ncbi:hypothetical protein MKX83_24230 [Cytobacillus sp. FSL M8-0252]|uniref:type II secretion system F family protein n=1 Tax=Cytobacillus sp. FSL M8-0252 TaxID=2921621 RepID=UPI0030F52B3E
MNIIVSVVGITIIALLAYITFIQISEITFKKKRQRLSLMLQDEEDRKPNKIVDWLDKRGILDYVSPSFIMSESNKYGVEISKQSFLSTFTLGTAIGIVVIVVYFQPIIFIMPLAILGGIIASNIKLHNIKKKYYQELDNKLAIYMSSLATAMSTFNNTKEALQSILPSLEYPIKNDVEEAIIKLQDGKSVKESFEQMNNRYHQKQVRLYHDQLDVIVKSGSTDVTSLRSIAFKMKRKEIYRKKLQVAHKENFKTWKAFVVLSLSAPFLFIFVSMDNYLVVMNHIASSIVFGLTFLLIFITYRQLEKLEVYDPTADEQVQI